MTSTNLLDPNLLSELLDFLKKNPSIHDEIKADCIIIDEGQDFNLEWLLFLQELPTLEEKIKRKAHKNALFQQKSRIKNMRQI